MIKVFLDSDVILDFLLKRGPFTGAAGVIFSLGERGKLRLLTSTLSFMNVHSIAGGATRQATARSLSQKLRALVDLLPVGAEHVDAAFASGLTDVEDYIQYAVARENHVDYLITRNTDDFPHDQAFVLTPTVLIDTLPG